MGDGPIDVVGDDFGGGGMGRGTNFILKTPGGGDFFMFRGRFDPMSFWIRLSHAISPETLLARAICPLQVRIRDSFDDDAFLDLGTRVAMAYGTESGTVQIYVRGRQRCFHEVPLVAIGGGNSLDWPQRPEFADVRNRPNKYEIDHAR